jgi:hypothetical protein
VEGELQEVVTLGYKQPYCGKWGQYRSGQNKTLATHGTAMRRNTNRHTKMEGAERNPLTIMQKGVATTQRKLNADQPLNNLILWTQTAKAEVTHGPD